MKGLKESLAHHDEVHVLRYEKYITGLQAKEDRARKITLETAVRLFDQVAAKGIPFDGVHVTLQKTGISFDFVAYRNMMFFTYPESEVDGPSLVYEGDEFEYMKESGKIRYRHTSKSPFSQKDDNIIGGFVVIKNRRGEFMTILDRDAISKHRRVARTDRIWALWFPEMCKKTIIKKACKDHFQDQFESVLEEDNKSSDVDKTIARDELSNLKLQILEELDGDQSDKYASIREECAKLNKSKKWTVAAAEDILKRLTE